MRDRTVLFFNYLFPLIFFFIFGFMMHADQGGAIVQIVNMVLIDRHSGYRDFSARGCAR